MTDESKKEAEDRETEEHAAWMERQKTAAFDRLKWSTDAADINSAVSASMEPKRLASQKRADKVIDPDADVDGKVYAVINGIDMGEEK